MILYFEIHYEDDHSYTIEKLCNSNKRDIGVEYIAQRLSIPGTYAFSIVVDTNRFSTDFKYGMAEIVAKVVNKMSRGKKIKKIIDNQNKISIL